MSGKFDKNSNINVFYDFRSIRHLQFWTRVKLYWFAVYLKISVHVFLGRFSDIAIVLSSLLGKNFEISYLVNGMRVTLTSAFAFLS